MAIKVLENMDLIIMDAVQKTIKRQKNKVFRTKNVYFLSENAELTSIQQNGTTNWHIFKKSSKS